ncbi:streptothricin acetyltransferase [Paenibacillus helianthi]|uniref:Streptothricin acetyltransferase n=1 Tax=Paenibacillus helianthi TaxID=1349432 RepID=A0ABX3EU86_9BACL|nr:GNAT family N-acetyltransferase [Paenibacillus helianthi]OKP88163.1 streptothricin acetyltransferase [Paenibacillus helianthi]
MNQNEVWRAHDEEASASLDISIREMAVEEQGCLADIDDSFIVDSVLVLSFSGNQFNYTVKDIPSYEKSYTAEVSEEADAADGSTELIHPDQVTYLAFAENQIVGRIVLKKNWNHYALIEMIQVDKAFRRHGVGRQLMEQARHWALEQELPGIMLETQSINVSACRFYESIGFVIGGFDKYVYRGIPKACEEVAVYWYLHFK